ncbi:trypsin-7-like [Armigeres subalbatus]|uniref:trypsin-7-like n=1 Tax=Armigeres subalbatus TaxID=124917 RepID=UPI002ED1781F
MNVFLVFALFVVAVTAGHEEDIWLQFNRRMLGAYYELKDRSLITGRIVGGIDANIENFPYQLSLRRNDVHNCGASVISDRWALSAAHCTHPLPDVDTISLRGGTSNRLEGGTIFTVELIVNHPQYNSWTLENDICVIRTVEVLQGLHITPIQLVPAETYYPHGTRAVVSGWGLTSVPGTSPAILQMIDIPLIDQVTCRAAWPGSVTDDMLCAGESGRSACSMDSGGPLVTGGRQIGVVSWGAPDCLGNRPSGYARVAHPPIRNWINDVTGV